MQPIEQEKLKLFNEALDSGEGVDFLEKHFSGDEEKLQTILPDFLKFCREVADSGFKKRTPEQEEMWRPNEERKNHILNCLMKIIRKQKDKFPEWDEGPSESTAGVLSRWTIHHASKTFELNSQKGCAFDFLTESEIKNVAEEIRTFDDGSIISYEGKKA